MQRKVICSTVDLGYVVICGVSIFKMAVAAILEFFI